MFLDDQLLKSWLQKDELQRIDKILLVMATFSGPNGISEIKSKARSVGCNMDKWNVSEILSRKKGFCLQVLGGYEIAEKGLARLRELGLNSLSPTAIRVAVDLRGHLDNIRDNDTRAFVEEAITCYEMRLYRSAIVMSWLSAMDILKKQVVASHLSDFNAEAKRINVKWKEAKNSDDLGAMNEGDFLNRISGISMIGKSRKLELERALNLRNGCSHPNSLKVGQNQVAAHMECLILNVFEIFNPF